MVQLRDFSTEDFPTLYDIFYHDNTEIKSDVVNLVGETNGENVLFILEGWDELPLHLREFVKVSKIKASIFINLVRHESLPLANIFVTSRHVATGDFRGRLQNKISRFVEVLGLTSSNIRTYIRQYLKDEARSSDLIGQLQDRPHIESMCYIPLNCRIVCELFAAQKGELPSTITEIYSQLINSSLQRHFEVKTFISYDDIPLKNKSTFYAICKLAYEGIINQKLVFTQKEIQDIVGAEFSETFDGFGLFQAVSFLHIHGSTKSFYFNHLTFQEYLAAYHIFHAMDHNEQLKLVKELVNKEQLNNAWKFFAGISKLKDFAIAQVLCRFELDDPFNKAKSVFHCAYEAQNADVCVLIADWVDSTIPKFFSVSAYDCLALSFVISNSADREWSIELPSCGVEGIHLRMLAKHIKRLQPKSLTLKCLDFSGNRLASKDIDCFSECAHAFSCIKALTFQHVFLSSENTDPLSKLVQLCPNILKINLDNNRLVNGASAKLINILQTTDTTEALSISGNSLGIKDACTIGKFIECLRILKLNKNHFNSMCIPVLCEGLCDNKSLKYLHMEENEIDESGFLSLLNTLVGSNVKVLSLKRNSIVLQSKQIHRLKDPLSMIQMLKKLDLSSCKMGGSVCFLIQNLVDNRSLNILNFQDNELTAGDINIICTLLANSTIKRIIDIRPNAITDFSCFTKLLKTRNAENWIGFAFSSHQSIEHNILQLKDAVNANSCLGKLKVIQLVQGLPTMIYPENFLEELSLKYCFVRITKLRLLNLEKIKQAELEFSSCTIHELSTTLETSNTTDVIALVECKL